MNSKCPVLVFALFGLCVVSAVSEDEDVTAEARMTTLYEDSYRWGIRYSLARGLFSELVTENKERVDKQDLAIVYGTPEYNPGFVLWATNQGKTRFYRVHPTEDGVRVDQAALNMQFAEFVTMLKGAIEAEPHSNIKATGNPISEYHIYIKHGDHWVEKMKLGMRLDGVFEILNSLLIYGCRENASEAEPDAAGQPATRSESK